MVRWLFGSIPHGVDLLSFFSFQPVLHDWCNKGRGMCNTNNITTTVFLSRTEDPGNAGTYARDRRALQQLTLNVHIKHSDLT